MLVISHYAELRPDGFHENHYEDILVRLDAGSVSDYKELTSAYAIYGPYCKLYHAKVINRMNLRFDESLISAEDFDFNIRYIREMNSICMIANSQYVYRVGYKKVNLGFIKDSDIKSAHLMSAGLVYLASRMGIYENVKASIAERVAEKHWLNRVPMILTLTSPIAFRKRKEQYNKLRGDKQYRELCQYGLKQLPVSFITKLLAKADRCEL